MSLYRSAVICIGLVVGFAALDAAVVPARSDVAYKVTSVINLPGGQKLGASGVDVGVADSQLSLYALADRTNNSVDIIDTTNNTLLAQVPGFFGLTQPRGPNGITFVDHKELWAADSISNVKVVDLATRTITRTIPLGGTGRAGKLCHDPENNVVLTVSDQETPFPFIQFINSKTYTVIKKIALDGTAGSPRATTGVEQCQWNPRTHLIYLAIPEMNGTGDHNSPGAVLVLNGATQSIVATFSVPPDACAGPQGMAIGPAPQILLGCSSNGNATSIINELDGSIVATFPGLIGNGDVTFNST